MLEIKITDDGECEYHSVGDILQQIGDIIRLEKSIPFLKQKLQQKVCKMLGGEVDEKTTNLWNKMFDNLSNDLDSIIVDMNELGGK